MCNINDKHHAFHLKEFELLRDEIRKRTDEQVATEKLAIFSTAAIYTFIAGLHNIPQLQDILLIMWWIPPLLILYALLRWQANDDMIQIIGKYIQRRSEYILAVNGHGWEHFNRGGSPEDGVKPTEAAHSSSFFYRVGNMRKAILEDKRGASRVWPIMEILRISIWIVTILLAITQTVF